MGLARIALLAPALLMQHAAASSLPKMLLIPNVTFVQGYSTVPLPANLTGNGTFPNRAFGSSDESPYTLSTVASLYASMSEVTNAQFESFDASHASLRGKYGFSVGDDEAVVFVTLFDAIAYTGWLSQASNATYRLPSEPEAEALIRAGSSTYFNTGNSFTEGNNQCDSWWPSDDGRYDPCTIVVNLTVCDHGVNAYGLCDTHGNVEEMTGGWYSDSNNASSTGTGYPLTHTFAVTRGGSHSSDDYYLRSASRAGMLPSDLSWYIGFRVVREVAPGNRHAAWCEQLLRGYPHPHLRWSDVYDAATGAVKSHDAANAALQAYRAARRSGVRQPPATMAVRVDARGSTAAAAPVWLPPLQYVHVDTPETIPFTTHNHDPALVACPNGDILATWFSTITESGRESGIVTSRLVANASVWPPARLFWKTPARMDNAPLMHYDATTGWLFHVHGMAASATWGANAVVMRLSTDCGVTWLNTSGGSTPASPSLILPEHRLHHQPVNTMWRTRDGAALVFFADNVTLGTGGTSMHASFDNGSTWSDTWDVDDEYILGIHGTAVELMNGSILAFGRGNDIDGNMAQSRSDDFGLTWVYSRSPWPGIHGGQRACHLRTQEGALLFCGFANTPIAVSTSCGTQRNVTGLFCASSNSEGDVWEHVRGMNDDGQGRVYEALDAGLWLMTATTGEPNGYTASAQGPDGMLHLISSRNHYRFNLAWVQTPASC